jgi:hypothetical protein
MRPATVPAFLAVLALAGAPLAAQTPAAATAPAAGAPIDSLALARKYTAWFYAGEMDSVLAHHNAEGRAEMTTAMLQERLMEVASRAGEEDSVIEEKFVKRNGQTQYWRTARFTTFTEEPLVFRLVILPTGEIGGMGFNPLSRTPPIDP